MTNRDQEKQKQRKEKKKKEQLTTKEIKDLMKAPRYERRHGAIRQR